LATMVPSWVETPRDPASWIGTELMQLVLGQLLPDVTAIADTDSSNKLISVLKDLALKNKSWAAAICEFSCSGARDAHVSAGELRIIKAQSSKINLSFLHEEFKLAAGADLGDFLLEDYVPGADAEEPGNVFKGMIWRFKKDFCTEDDTKEGFHALAEEQFVIAVERAYIKLLVIKSVETLAIARHEEQLPSLRQPLNAWIEKCMVSKIVDVMWHCHLLHPKHYLETCSSLLGSVAIIDHDPGYISPHKHKGSNLADKIDALYWFEKLNKKLIYLGDAVAEVLTVSEAMWLDAAFEDVCEHDDMECG